MYVLTLQLERSALKIIGKIREALIIFKKLNLHNFFSLFPVSISLSAWICVTIKHKIGRTSPWKEELQKWNYKGEASGGGRSCFSVTSRLIILKFSGNATFYIYFISQKRYFLENVLWGCHVGMPLLRGWGRLLVRLKFLFWFDVWLPSGVWKTKFLLWKHFLWAWGLFSACNLNSEWLQFVRKLY